MWREQIKILALITVITLIYAARQSRNQKSTTEMA